MGDGRRSFRSYKPAVALGLGIFVCLAVGVVASFGVLEPYRLKTLDQFFRLLPLEPPHPEVMLITIDQPDIEHLAARGVTWPWPREFYASILDFCRRGGARAVIFDILFTEESRYGPEDDRKFARALAEMPAFLACFLTREDKPLHPLTPEVLGKGALRLSGPGPPGPEYRAVIPPLGPLLQAATGVGNVECGPDPDGIYRRLPLAGRFQGHSLPLLAFAAYSRLGNPGEWRYESGELVRGELRLPLDDQGRFLLKFRGPARTFPRLSAADLITSEMNLRQGQAPLKPPEALAGKWVLVGLTAPGLLDLKASPVSAVYPGVELHATLLDNLLRGDFLRPLPLWLLGVWSFLMALCGAAAVLFSLRLWLTGLAALGVAAAVLGVSVLGFRADWWIDPVLPGLAAGLAFAAAAAYSYVTEGRQKLAIRRMFSHYLSEAVIRHLLEHPERLKLGGERRRVTLFFSDLAGFTSLSEKLAPEDVVALLNDYLSRMTDIILAEEGVVDKFEGDAIMAMWGAPLEQPDQAVRACRAALRQVAALHEVNAGLAARGLPPLRMRIGIHTGEAVVGNLGSHRRFDYTAVGDAVNLASRLEGLNKYYGTAILVSEDTAAALDGALEIMEVDQVAVKGRETPVRVFQVLAPAGELSPEALAAREAYVQGLAAYRERRFDEAMEYFARSQELLPEGNPAGALVERCRRLLAEPPPEWDGVFRPEGK
ncbi:MAG: adenylate/guanylate cyclase domain-containing protein [Desulfobaccales bacterium]